MLIIQKNIMQQKPSAAHVIMVTRDMIVSLHIATLYLTFDYQRIIHSTYISQSSYVLLGCIAVVSVS